MPRHHSRFSDVGLSFLLNAINLLYCMLPGTQYATAHIPRYNT